MPDPIKVPAVILCRLFTFHNFDENSNFENLTKLGNSLELMCVNLFKKGHSSVGPPREIKLVVKFW